jgi:hypothetical protein
LQLSKDGKSEIFTVSGVMAKLPHNSSLQFDMIAAFDNALVDLKKDLGNWRNSALVTTFVEIENKQLLTSTTRMLSQYTTVQNRLNADWRIEAFYLQPSRKVRRFILNITLVENMIPPNS